MSEALVLVNEQSGRVLSDGVARIEKDVTSALRSSGAMPRFVTGKVPALLDALQASNADAVITVGGDGTIGAVAGALAERDDPPRFVPLPFGTANLFTRDLGLPLDPMKALEEGMAAPARRIDYARANDHPLLHSAVFGTFAEIAEEREEMRKGGGLGAVLGAAVEGARRLLTAEPVAYHLEIDGQPLEAETNVVFVTNNAITGGQRGVPVRDRLDAGELVVYVSDSLGPLGFMKRVIEAVTGGFDESDGIIRHVCRSACVTARGAALIYSADGEVVEDEDAVRFDICPGRLSVPDLRSGERKR
ncbi:diacylglycerol/lipid kinase family protein [Parvularcula dongshanensis]|uniref:Diacylglycerol kinase family enzyme n=1 Tax=Parvularcula dongshanensis TaxID=1173995 RepID=A0A840I0E6_9PROT|nr:diacylglycerol kinase family protein [Parvularcula dongshanensis]MBB4657648.1 diacylglycerol kinase family enzyme [Parvularcula dongshanensis]